jgi:diguanylate cyclase (GGDEF)-like protein
MGTPSATEKQPVRVPPAPSQVPWDAARPGSSWCAFTGGFRGVLLVAVCLFTVGAICLFDSWSKPGLSFAILYLAPVACAAWWGGFASGTLVALASAVAWHGIDSLEGPRLATVIHIWNALTRFGTFAITSSLLSRLHLAVLRERALARNDPLTGAANGRTFYEAAGQAIEQALRTGTPLTLAYLDLDDFKQVNDRLGHAAGDEVLRRVADAVLRNIRAYDTLARLGGDEFALLLPGTDGAQAAALLNRLHDLLCQEAGPGEWPLTVSIGAVTFPQPSRDTDVMMRRVDAMMYAAKLAGKGKVEHRVARETEVQADGAMAERRTDSRILCDRPVRVRAETANGTIEELGLIRDLSTRGLRLRLGRRLALDTLVTVDWQSAGGARTLMARIIHSVPDRDSWLHGCALVGPLSAQELLYWLREEPSAAETVAAQSS